MARTTKSAQAAARLTELQNMVEYLKDKGVSKVSMDGISIEFFPFSTSFPSAPDMTKSEEDELKELLKADGATTEDNLYWSAE